MKKLFLLFACALMTTLHAQTTSRNPETNQNRELSHNIDTIAHFDDNGPLVCDPAEIIVLSQDDFANKLTVKFHYGQEEGSATNYSVTVGGLQPLTLASGKIVQEDQIVEFNTTNWPHSSTVCIFLKCSKTIVTKYVNVNPTGNLSRLQLTLLPPEYTTLQVRYKFTTGVNAGVIKVFKNSDFVKNSYNSTVIASNSVDDRNTSHIVTFGTKYWMEDTYVVVLFENGKPVCQQSIKCGKKTVPSISAAVLPNVQTLEVCYQTSSVYQNVRVEVMLKEKGSPAANGNFYYGTSKLINKNVDILNGSNGVLQFDYSQLCEGDYEVALYENEKKTASCMVTINPLGALTGSTISRSVLTVNYCLGSKATKAQLIVTDTKGVYNRTITLPLTKTSYNVVLPSSTTMAKAMLVVNGIPVPTIRLNDDIFDLRR